jgi:mono/diheme cytochrome c family protein
VMPAFQGQVNEEQVLALIAYIESLRVPTPSAPPPAAARTQARGASTR